MRGRKIRAKQTFYRCCPDDFHIRNYPSPNFDARAELPLHLQVCRVSYEHRMENDNLRYNSVVLDFVAADAQTPLPYELHSDLRYYAEFHTIFFLPGACGKEHGFEYHITFFYTLLGGLTALSHIYLEDNSRLTAGSVYFMVLSLAVPFQKCAE